MYIKYIHINIYVCVFNIYIPESLRLSPRAGKRPSSRLPGVQIDVDMPHLPEVASPLPRWPFLQAPRKMVRFRDERLLLTPAVHLLA